MYLGSGKVLAPVFFLVFAIVLLGLLAAQSPSSSPASQPEALAPSELPWAPLGDPAPAMWQVSTLLTLIVRSTKTRNSRTGSRREVRAGAPARTRCTVYGWKRCLRHGDVYLRLGLSNTPRNEKFAQLEELSNDRSQSPRTRGLAAFALGLHQLERKRIAPAVESFRTPEIDATELGGFALFYIARELEASKPGDALKAIAALKASHPDFPLMDEARLRYARILKAKGEREEAIRKLGSLTQSTDDAARGDALDELSNLFIGLGRFQDAVDVLETLYYELPQHNRANNGGRRLTGLRKKLPEVEPARYYELGMKRAGILMEQGRYRDVFHALRVLDCSATAMISAMSRSSGLQDDLGSVSIDAVSSPCRLRTSSASRATSSRPRRSTIKHKSRGGFDARRRNSRVSRSSRDAFPTASGRRRLWCGSQTTTKRTTSSTKRSPASTRS